MFSLVSVSQLVQESYTLVWPIEPFGPRQTGDQRGLVVAQEWLSGGEQSSLLMNDCAGARRSGPGRSSSAPEELMPIQAKGQEVAVLLRPNSRL
ncbi:hypothetical protein WJX77_004114 [Trebouxia sp. C0004]